MNGASHDQRPSVGHKVPWSLGFRHETVQIGFHPEAET